MKINSRSNSKKKVTTGKIGEREIEKMQNREKKTIYTAEFLPPL